MGKPTFTKKDIGCYFDGARGVYLGEAIQKMAASYGWQGEVVTTESDVYDDATDEAIDYLNGLCSEDVYFLYDNDFLLVEQEDEDKAEPEIDDDDIRLDHIPDVAECRRMLKDMAKDKFWPNVWHVNDHGNVDLLSIGYNGAKIVKSWV